MRIAATLTDASLRAVTLLGAPAALIRRDGTTQVVQAATDEVMTQVRGGQPMVREVEMDVIVSASGFEAPGVGDQVLPSGHDVPLRVVAVEAYKAQGVAVAYSMKVRK